MKTLQCRFIYTYIPESREKERRKEREKRSTLYTFFWGESVCLYTFYGDGAIHILMFCNAVRHLALPCTRSRASAPRGHLTDNS
jgi:hypothetical protein